MRHRVIDKKFNRTSNERKALFQGLLRSLTEHGTIVTTEKKAKQLKRLADRMIRQAQDNSLGSRRLLHKTFGKRDVVNTLVDTVAPAMKDRTSGFTRITSMGNRRGDNTKMVRIELVNKPAQAGLANPKPAATQKKAKVAKVAKAAAAEKTEKVEKAAEPKAEKKVAAKKPAAAKKAVK